MLLSTTQSVCQLNTVHRTHQYCVTVVHGSTAHHTHQYCVVHGSTIHHMHQYCVVHGSTVHHTHQCCVVHGSTVHHTHQYCAVYGITVHHTHQYCIVHDRIVTTVPPVQCLVVCTLRAAGTLHSGREMLAPELWLHCDPLWAGPKYMD